MMCASFLAVPDILWSLSLVCKSLSQISILPALWSQLFRRHFEQQLEHWLLYFHDREPTTSYSTPVATSEREWRRMEHRKAFRNNVSTLHLSFEELSHRQLWSSMNCGMGRRRRVFDWRKAFVWASLGKERGFVHLSRTGRMHQRHSKAAASQPSTSLLATSFSLSTSTSRLPERSATVSLGLGPTGRAKVEPRSVTVASGLRESSSLSIISPNWAHGSLPPAPTSSLVASIPVCQPQMNRRPRTSTAKPHHRGRCLTGRVAKPVETSLEIRGGAVMPNYTPNTTTVRIPVNDGSKCKKSRAKRQGVTPFTLDSRRDQRPQKYLTKELQSRSESKKGLFLLRYAQSIPALTHLYSSRLLHLYFVLQGKVPKLWPYHRHQFAR
jgi:hypothetical protein